MNQFWAGRWPRDCFGLQGGPRRDVSSIRPSSTVTLSRRGPANRLNNTTLSALTTTAIILLVEGLSERAS